MKIPRRNSMVNEAADSLRDAIRNGEFTQHLPGVRKLSRDLHVSIPTVSGAIRVLEAEGMVRSEPGRRTRILAGKLTSRPRRKRQYQVAFLTCAPNWLTGSDYYQSVLNELRELEISIRIFDFAHAIQRIQNKDLEELTAAESPDCWVLFGPPAEVQSFFAKKQLPCIIDGVTIPGLPLPDFEVDFGALYRHAVNRLQGGGHRKICLVTTTHSARINPETISIFRDAVQKKLSPETAWEPVRTYDGSVEHFQGLLRSLFADKKRAPSALVIAMVKRVTATMMWLMKHGLKVPEDVSIISRDYDDILENLYPLPAHYRQPPTAHKRFVRAILAVIDKKHIRSNYRIMTDFFEGETLAAITPSQLPYAVSNKQG